MRALTKKQKNLLDKWFEQDKEEKSKMRDIMFEIISCGLFETLEKINDTEILYQNVNSYITDKIINYVHCEKRQTPWLR